MSCFWYILDLVESYREKCKFLNPERKVLFHVHRKSMLLLLSLMVLLFEGSLVMLLLMASVDITIWSMSVDDAVCGKSEDGIVFGKASDGAVGGKSVRRLWYPASTVREPLTGIAARPDTKMLIRSLHGIRSGLLGLFKGWSKEGRSSKWNQWCDDVWYWNGKLGSNLFANL